ncbi:DEAD/DEAH box helicase [Barnesiella viscericola]|uniref:DEAD/DEAH box helicase n=1 Tax=Barnesiella viscericola TaxID=397865 RepID=UPI0025A3FC62|nr:DEAD/DEAH box helicase [Barnesiella viscericola]MDM8269287.1 DEAD/DEAH box helicase [Barnesiella viscericola]
MKTFQELGICDEILKAITELGYEKPMPVQEQVIPHLLNEETDLVALAQTGTGKTAAFGLPVIQRIDRSLCQPQALILSPTRELCLQIAGDLTDYSQYIDGLTILPVYGGSSIESQIRTLKKGVHIIVATPGRLLDLLERKTVRLDHVSTVIMDEADEMLNMGFLDSINAILAQVPQERKMLLFSATMPREIEQIARTYMHNPQEIVVGSRNEGAENVRHVYYMVHAKDKYQALKRIADYYPNIYGIIFCRTRRETQEIADQLIADGYNADSLHGELSQAQRDAVMQKFRLRNLQLLVATDVAARGLDVTDLTHVINYGLPDDIETYTHRSGRTGRAGKSGVSVAIIHSREKGKMRAIEKIIGKKFERGLVPTGEQICEKQLFNLADRIEKVKVNEEAIAKYLPNISRKLGWLNEQDLIKRIVSLEFNRLIDYYRDTPDLDLPDENTRKPKAENGGAQEGRKDRNKDSRTAEEGFERIYINLGKAHGFFPPNLIEMINSLVPGRVNIGRIDLLPAYSLFDVEKGAAKKVVGALKGNEFYGHRIYAEIATDKDYAAKGRKKGGKEREGDGRRKGEKRYGSQRKGGADSRYKHERRSSNPRKERRK